jgi:sulfotransferase
MKNIYFLGGLPRSGNTLLSSLLNQNPDIYSSPLSPLLDNLTVIEHLLNSSETTLSTNFEKETTLGLKNFVKGFYSDIDKPIIIDRNKGWGSKDSTLKAIRYITDNPKIIYTVRDIPSILSSFLLLIENDQNNFIDNNIRSIETKPYGKQTQDDLRCDWLMNNQVGLGLAALTDLLQTKVSICLIEYDDLIENPQAELNKVYDFLKLNHYSHDFNNIEKLEKETLEIAGLPSNLHDVHSKIKKSCINPESVLSELTLNKYSNMEFWRDQKTN